MAAVTHSQLTNLIEELPPAKLQAAYDFLRRLLNKEADPSSFQERLLQLPLSERREVMAAQAEKIKEHYEQTFGERQDLQGGDFFDDY